MVQNTKFKVQSSTSLFRLIVLLLVFVPLVADAQLRGRVTMPDGSPATYATVMLFADSNAVGTPRAYSMTDGKGKFHIKTAPSAGNWLAVRYMGYEEFKMAVGESRNDIEIKLKAKSKVLNAVKVGAKMKSVEVSGDTIKFNTEYFKTGAEDNAAEVLNKIPGMEVSDNGDVSYGGQKVDKVTIDGKDLFTSGSDGTLNTLSADALQGAEILRNAKRGSLVDDFSGRDMTTLNLKTDGRTRLNGKLAVMGGYSEKLKTENSLLLIGKKVSLSSILSANNTGDAVFSFMDYFQQIVGLENLLTWSSKGPSFSEDELAMLIPRTNIHRSLGGVASLSGNWQPSEKFRMKGNVILNGTAVDAISLSTQEFFSLGITNRHEATGHTGNGFVSAQLQQTWKPRKEIEFSNRTRVTHSSMRSLDTINEYGVVSNHTDEDNRMRRMAVEDEMVLNVELGDNLLSTHMTMEHSERNYNYALTTDGALLPLTYYTLLDSNYRIDNDRLVSSTTVAPDITYAIKLGNKYTLNTSLAVSGKTTRFDHTPERGDTVSADLTTGEASLGVELNKNKGTVRFTLGANAVETLYRSNITEIDHRSNFAILPHGSFMLHFSSTHRLTLSASMSHSEIELDRLIRQPYVTSHSSLYRGSYIDRPYSETGNVSASYYIFDQFSNTLFIVAAGISGNRFTLKPYSLQDSSTFTSTVYDNNGSSTTRYLSSNISKGLGSFPADLKLSASLQQNSSQTSVNDANGDIESLSHSVSLDFVTRSKKALNSSIGASYSSSTSMYTATVDVSSTMHQYSSNASVSLTLKKFKGTVSFAYTHLDSRTYDSDVYDLGFRMEYQLGKWRLLLRGRNLMNLDDMEWLSVSSTPYYISTTHFRKMPGYLIGGVAYRF